MHKKYRFIIFFQLSSSIFIFRYAFLIHKIIFEGSLNVQLETDSCMKTFLFLSYL